MALNFGGVAKTGGDNYSRESSLSAIVQAPDGAIPDDVAESNPDYDFQILDGMSDAESSGDTAKFKALQEEQTRRDASKPYEIDKPADTKLNFDGVKPTPKKLNFDGISQEEKGLGGHLKDAYKEQLDKLERIVDRI